MFYTDKLMPETGPEGFTAKKGFESESEASQNKHAKAGNKAALVNNEL
jgi:hypothetical protein